MHEKHLAENLYKALGSDRFIYKELRQWKHFETIATQFKLFVWAFKNANAAVNVCVARLAIPAILRNLFNENKIIVVWHYYDTNDGKSKFLKNWYHALVNLATWIPKKKLCFVAVSPFWEQFFQDYFELKQVLLFPNYFDPIIYSNYQKIAKKKQIHLGQESFKNSREVFNLAKTLSEHGYLCYFSSNDPAKMKLHTDYEVRHFANFEEYLTEMAASEYTLAMPYVNEGWNRVAHESLLVGTQVIGFDKGGLGDLLKGANAFLVGEIEYTNTANENYGKTIIESPSSIIEQVLTIILSNKQKPINLGFLKEFEMDKTGKALVPLLDWCRKKIT